ncbi:uncharacterized protein LOC122817317 isoform X2 [Protopterus annectens]|uniref:uncharacterized protein LOC122817317 isoform X2 n=1 Tax=Protopterus annectens TaxID=7888 RepID=UPI001CFC2B7C|nr:uncharacterized protein LOC122817317 isoform X2 [Protopterus annectens]
MLLSFRSLQWFLFFVHSIVLAHVTNPKEWYPEKINITEEGMNVIVTFDLAPPEFQLTKYHVYYGKSESMCAAPDLKIIEVLVDLSSNLPIGKTTITDMASGINYTIMVSSNEQDAVRKQVYYKPRMKHSKVWYPECIDVAENGHGLVSITFDLAPCHLQIFKYVVLYGELLPCQETPHEFKKIMISMDPSSCPTIWKAELRDLVPGTTYTVMIAVDKEDATNKSVKYTVPRRSSNEGCPYFCNCWCQRDEYKASKAEALPVS